LGSLDQIFSINPYFDSTDRFLCVAVQSSLKPNYDITKEITQAGTGSQEEVIIKDVWWNEMQPTTLQNSNKEVFLDAYIGVSKRSPSLVNQPIHLSYENLPKPHVLHKKEISLTENAFGQEE